VERVVREPTHREGGRIGAADDDGAGPAEIGHHRVVAGGHQVLEGDYPVVGGTAGLVHVDLGGDGHAVERAHRPAAGQGLVGGRGLREGRVVKRAHHRVDPRVDRVEARQGGGDDLTAGDGLPADHLRQLDGVEAPELGRYGPVSSV